MIILGDFIYYVRGGDSVNGVEGLIDSSRKIDVWEILNGAFFD